MTKNPTKLEHLVLAILEEAGEEEVTTLTNTVLTGRRGSPQEIDKMIRVLTALTNAGLIEAARSRDRLSRQWISLSKEESLAMIGALRPAMKWSAHDQYWKWSGDLPCPEIVLTAAGTAAATKVLTEEGWPTELA